ncbi:hypothetical protein B566_EDAN012828 [Ephemera danica]|nr:hypothetical protein B566_EDAN012828 [Ephemera danica]
MAPVDLRVVECRSRTVKLVWSEPHDGNSPIKHYNIHYSTNPDHWSIPNPQQIAVQEQTSAEIENLRPATTYFFRVSAVNDIGSGSTSNVVSAATELEAPTGPPLELRATPAGSRALHVQWAPPQSDLWNGPILGYYLGMMPVRGPQERRYSYVTVKVSEGLRGEWILRELATPNAPVQDVRCKAIDSQSLQLTWSPPPVSNQNGVIQGYRVLLELSEPGYNNLSDKSDPRESVEPTIIVRGLQKFSNYSIRVSAFTVAGDGNWSEPITCLTAEDVPGPPAGIKAALSAPHTALVSWAAPIHPNGIILQYHVYEREVKRGVPSEPTRHTLGSDKTVQALPLREHSTYEFWVTAVTTVGEGTSTRVFSISPNSRASIVTFDSELEVPWRTSLALTCTHVGRPPPEITWSVDGRSLNSGSRQTVMSNGSLVLRDLQFSDAGNYSCRVANIHGHDVVTHILRVLVPPRAPILDVITVHPNNVTLRWSTTDGAGAPSILAFILNMKREYGEWQEIRLPRELRDYTVNALPCGTLFYFYVSAVNRVGTGDASQVRSVRTRGSRPIAPESNIASSSGQRSLTFHLDQWQDGDCELQSFIIERLFENDDWRMITDEAAPGTSYTISGLESARVYHIRVTAQNNRGTTTTVFKVSTLTALGATISPTDLNFEAKQSRPFYTDLNITIPISISVMAVMLTITTVLICLRKKLDTNTPAEQLNSTSGPQTPAKTDYYSTLTQKHSSPLARDNVPHHDMIERVPDYGEDIYPYATFQVAQKAQLDAHTDYTVSSRRSHRNKCMRSDSEEYDSLGSDSDTEHATSSRTESSNQLEESQREKLAGFRGYLHSNMRHADYIHKAHAAHRN